MRLGILGPLRGPAGINPLATKGSGDLSPPPQKRVGDWLGSALAAKNHFPAGEKKTLNFKVFL